MASNEVARKNIEIPADELAKFEARHPSRGAFTWFVREALRNYNEINDTSPDELMKLAVNEINLL